MKIAIASCFDLPDWEKDDLPFFRALEANGIEYQILPWDSDTDWHQFDACLLRTTWDYQDRFEEFMGWVDRVSTQTQLINPTAIIRWNSHKRYLQELQHAGITIAPSEWLLKGKLYNIEKLMQQHGWKKGFIKPLVGANARECLPFENTAEGIAEAQKHADRLTPTEDLVLQPYLSNVESFGETSGIFFAGEYSHGTRKVPVKGDFRVQDDYGASDYPYQLSDEERELAQKAIAYVTKTISLPLYARVDFLHHKDGAVYVNEVELIEPSLFFRHGGKQSCELFTQALAKFISDTH
ncbi:hypothetical protein [Kangiella marina]